MKWHDTDESCPDCGDTVIVLSESKDWFDGDTCKCCSCSFVSCMSVDEDGNSWIQKGQDNE